MTDYDQAFCPSPECKDYGQRHQGNIAYRGRYGKNKDRALLYCRTCGTRFAATHGTALFGLHLPADLVGQIIHHAAEGMGVRAIGRVLHRDKDTVNRVILRVGKHCAVVLTNLLVSLQLTEVQLDELWTFVKKRRLLPRTTPRTGTAKPGCGRPLMPPPA